MIIKYSKKFAYAPYLNYDVGFEEEFKVSSDDVEAVMAALRKLDFIAEKFHKENNPQLGEPIAYSEPPYGNIPVEQVSKPIGTVDALIADINSCESVKVLESYSLLVKKSPWLQEAYDRKMDELMSTAFKKNDKINNNERDKIQGII